MSITAGSGVEVIPVDTPALGDRSYLAHDGSAALAVDLQRDIDRVLALAAARSVPGSGLGVVREPVTAHGCTVQAASPSSGKSVFTVRLPARTGPQAGGPGDQPGAVHLTWPASGSANSAHFRHSEAPCAGEDRSAGTIRQGTMKRTVKTAVAVGVGGAILLGGVAAAVPALARNGPGPGPGGAGQRVRRNLGTAGPVRAHGHRGGA